MTVVEGWLLWGDRGVTWNLIFRGCNVSVPPQNAYFSI